MANDKIKDKEKPVRKHKDKFDRLQAWREKHDAKRKNYRQEKYPTVEVVNALAIDVEIPVDVTSTTQLLSLVEKKTKEEKHDKKHVFKLYGVNTQFKDFGELKTELGKLVNFTN